MTLQPTSSLLVCTWLYLVTMIAAAGPARVLEARQGGPIITIASSDKATSTSPTTMSPASTSGTSSATPQPSSSAGSLVLTVHNMTTCNSGLISWNYTGKEADMYLSVTSIGVDQYYILPRLKTRDDISSVDVEQLVIANTSALSWRWPAVNVTQGWYQIQGTIALSPVLTNNSAPFFISNGTDVSCLTGTSQYTSSTASSSSSVSSVSAAQSHLAGIVAGVVGAIVGVAVAFITGICICMRKRRKSFPASGGSRDRKWGTLNSDVSSIQPLGATQLTHTHSESVGTMVQVMSGGKGSMTTTPGGSEEDVTTAGEEKLVSPTPSGISPTDVLNTPLRYDRRTSLQSVQTPTTTASDVSRTRASSQNALNQSLEQQAQRIRSSMEASFRRSERLSMPTLPSPSISRLHPSPTRLQSREEYPLSPMAPVAINRSISTGGVPGSMPVRRASRKPVPQYDPSVLSTLEDTNADTVSTFTAGAESSQSHGTGMGTGAHGAPSELAHKASFGDGRPVHYLIPDMPSPQQD